MVRILCFYLLFCFGLTSCGVESPVEDASIIVNIETQIVTTAGLTTVVDVEIENVDGTSFDYYWQQSNGPDVSYDASILNLSFIAPEVTINTTMNFELTITDSKGKTSQYEVEIVVYPYKLASLSNFTFQGAFRVDGTAHGDSSANYANGSIAYNELNNSLFLVGHTQEHAIAEYVIPEELNEQGTPVQELKTAIVFQEFVKFFENVDGPNEQGLNRITGMKLVEDELWVNVAEYYDADSNVSDTTAIIHNPENLKEMSTSPFYAFEGDIHAAGWISNIPPELEQLFESSFIAGYASNIPINSRHSIGPTLFTFSPSDANNSLNIPTTALMDFSLKTPLHEDSFNETLTNDLWTEVSKAFHGFIIPETYTYAVIGSSGGHQGGLGYKITQDNGNKCNGYCTSQYLDNYNYYWLFDVQDFIAVKNGLLEPNDITPYEYGEFPTPFSSKTVDGETVLNLMSGATYDLTSKTMYIVLDGAGQIKKFDKSPVILVYKVE